MLSIYQAVQSLQSHPSTGTDLYRVIERLQYDWDFIAEFLDDPRRALQQYKLTPEEQEALCARDIRALEALGLDRFSIEVAMSNAHSQTCPTGL